MERKAAGGGGAGGARLFGLLARRSAMEGSRPGIFGYVTGERPLPEPGDSATGERLLPCNAGGSAGGDGSSVSSDEVVKVVMPLSVEGARGRVSDRERDRRIPLPEEPRGFEGVEENRARGTPDC